MKRFLELSDISDKIYKDIASQSGRINKNFGVQTDLSIHASVYLVTYKFSPTFTQEKTFSFTEEGKEEAISYYNSL